MSTNEEGVVEQYNTLGRPSATMKDPELWDKIHDSVEFGAAYARRRKVVIKVRTIKHLRETLEEKYNTYLSHQCLSTYLQFHHQNTFAACHHHHPAKVGLASIARTDMKSHVDEYYCLASVKAVKIFAEVFADESIIISQDDKAKIGLGIPAVGRTFKTIQSVNEPVTVEDHDFPTGSKMKLIPSVYLVINPADSSNTLRTGQLSIFIRPEYFIGTSSATHIADLESIVKNENFSNTLKKEDKVRPIWVLLIDDYLTVRTHAPGQSAYNPVERSMISLSEKLAGITLPIEEFGPHLNSQGNVIDEELARRNFEYSGKKLCDIWKRDNIHEKPVTVEYVDQERNPFDEPEPSISWEWIEEHTQLCRYLLDIKKYENNGFLPPTTKEKDGHFINPIHALQYHDKLKILKYDRCCLSIPHELHQRLCCDICSKYFLTLKFVKEHKRNIHSHYNKRRTQQKRNSKRTANEMEMECVVIPLNFNVAEDIIQRNPWQEIEQNVCEVQSDRE
ncbi:hypothetical protein GLOIN_2v1766467 [Rhizophagus irregularis DAOM 181602=DAOM 197198]|nr:hypothetical protein GLOIN_2v1766467 [Rhizophagus irregularis DAOM 181602=DAOM 197198]